MNTIKAIVDKSSYGYNDYLNYQIDGCWLDEKLEKIYPNNDYGGLIPTLLAYLEIEKEEMVVWERILPKEGQVTICPILMCPDDNDFCCTLIMAEIENKGATIVWRKLGIDHTTDFEPALVGTSVKWFDEIQSLRFDKTEYWEMINCFSIREVYNK